MLRGTMWLSVLGMLGMLGAMFWQLYWTRDRLAYAGRNRAGQLTNVFTRAGLRIETIPVLLAAEEQWPLDVRYEMRGDAAIQSYARYILAPRVPSGPGAQFGIDLDRLAVTAVVPLTTHSKRSEVCSPSAGAAWGASLLAVILIGAGLATGSARIRPDMAEGMAAAVLLLALLAWATRAVTGSAPVGFHVFSLLAAIAGARLACLAGRARSICARPTAATAVTVSEPRYATGRSIRDDVTKSALPPACIGVACMAALLSSLLSVTVLPDDWDAWATWAPKAKVLALGTGDLADVTHFGHADYPLLWPALWAYTGWWAGGWEEQWARGWGAVFLLATAYCIGTFVHRRSRDIGLACFVATLFAATPKVVVVSSWSYAEAPYWMFAACCFGRWVAAMESGRVRDAMWAGVFGAGAMWTKNEGVLLAALGGLGLLWVARRSSARWRAVLAYALPIGLLYGPWFVWTRLVLHLGSHVTDGAAAETGMRVMVRAPQAAEAVVRMWLDPTQWGVTLVAIAIFLVAGLRRGTAQTRRYILFPLVLLGGHFLVVVQHHLEIGWLVGSAWDRLTIQSLPLLLMAGVASAGNRAHVRPGASEG